MVTEKNVYVPCLAFIADPQPPWEGADHCELVNQSFHLIFELF